MKPRITVFPHAESLARNAADSIANFCRQTARSQGRADLVLSGGSSPLAAYELLAAEPYAGIMPWSYLNVFWGDERAVPPDHPQSNFGAWLSHGGNKWPLPPKQVHPMPGHMGAEQGAALYEDILRRRYGPSAQPRFDLVLLGLGPDGHFASLFPHVRALQEDSGWVAPIDAPSRIEPHLPRISLTPAAINGADRVLFLAAGAGKAETLARILGPGAKPDPALPASMLRPKGEYLWYLDEAAARLL